MFKPVSSKVDFDAMEKGVLSFWQENDTFKKSLAQTEGGEEFVFFDGPPFATGLPHYGHLLAGTIKDIIPRYQTMRGKHVERRFGWDTHGLPIEALAQKALGIDGAAGIRELGVDKFNEQCRSMVLRYVSEWRSTVTRMGRWVDFDNDYKTMEPTFMETVWWVFKQIFDNYKDVQDPTVTCRLKVLSGADPAWGTTYLLIWTTTPWTLPENLAVCAGAKIDYVVVRDKGEGVCYVMAEARLPAIYRKADDYEVVARFKGDALKGWTYEPLFPYFEAERARGAFRVLNDDYVTTDDGVGLVHIAPAYGEDDFRVCSPTRSTRTASSRTRSRNTPAASARTATRTSSSASRPRAGSSTRRRSRTPTRSASAPTRRSSTARSPRGTSASRTSTSASRRTTPPSRGCPNTSARSASPTGSPRRATGTSRATASGARASRSG